MPKMMDRAEKTPHWETKSDCVLREKSNPEVY
jgi:hypothetical protein